LTRSDIPDILKSAFKREDNGFLDDYEDDFEDDDDDDTDEIDDGDLLATRISVEEMWETFRNNPTVRKYNGKFFLNVLSFHYFGLKFEHFSNSVFYRTKPKGTLS
jgi:hypothetical protein